MKTRLLILLLLAAVASCDCGEGDSPSSDSGETVDDDGDDDISPDDDDDSTDDDTTDDDADDDTSLDDDTSPDDDNLAKDCWEPDLPPEDGYEWRVTTAAELIDTDGTSVHFVFDGETPVVYWLQYPTTSHRVMLRARWDESSGEWNTISFYGRDKTVSALDVDVGPDGRIRGAMTSCNAWSGSYLCVCDLTEDSIDDCHGTPWDDVRPTFVSLDHTPDGRAGILFWDFGLHPWYTEETSPGVWELGTIPGSSTHNTGDLTIGPDGVAHFTWSVTYLRHYFGGVNETWSWDFLADETNLNGLGNIAISSNNEIYLGAGIWTDGDEATGVLHRQGWSRWEFLTLNEPWNNSDIGNRVALDAEDRLIQAYSFHDTHSKTVLCWARREGDLWRKEIVEIEEDSNWNLSYVYGLEVSAAGVDGILYRTREWEGENERAFLKVALRVPVEGN